VYIFDAVVVVGVVWMDLWNSLLWILVICRGGRYSLRVGYESSCILMNEIQ
jgi:hypothetical protein